MSEPKLEKLEDMTAEGLWLQYAQSQLPPVAVTGEFVREQIRIAYMAGAWTMLALEDRLRRESSERRTTLLDRFRGEYESVLHSVAGERPS